MQAATEIVNPANILAEDAMFAEKWTHAKIVLRNRGDETRRCIEWLVERRLIHNSQKCGTCNENCKLNRYQQGIDGYRWRCRPYNYTQSIRNSSFFEKSKLPPYKLIELIYYWAQCTPPVNSSTRNSGDAILHNN